MAYFSSKVKLYNFQISVLHFLVCLLGCMNLEGGVRPYYAFQLEKQFMG